MAEAANKAKSTFLFNMSHDIRTPMNAIVGYTELILNDHTDEEKTMEYLRKIQSSSDFLLSLINNVLEMARIESDKMVLDEVPVQKEQVIEEINDVYTGLMKQKNITFISEADIRTKYIYADRVKIKEILLNLISNAYKYTPEGGSISLIRRELPCEKKGYIMIETIVSDTGIGMAKEFLPTLFDEFSREQGAIESKVQGTGLGMAIVKRLVDFIGGTITVESELGKGTTFTLHTIHRKAGIDDIQREEEKEVNTYQLEGKRVLLAEDNDLNAEIATAILQKMGILVDRASDGIICVEMLLKAEKNYYDLILMDVQMPNMNGYKATQTIRAMADKDKREIPIIAMTANAFEEDKKEALAAGMDGYLAKPIERKKFTKLVATILG